MDLSTPHPQAHLLNCIIINFTAFKPQSNNSYTNRKSWPPIYVSISVMLCTREIMSFITSTFIYLIKS